MSAVLWHIPVSHFNEKARWALDRKGIAYEARAPTPGAHMAVALWLTRGAHKTFPVLQLDGRAIGDSSAIIAALDEYQAEPRLIPADPAQQTRALAIESFFDAELGPQIRLMAFHELRRDPEAMSEFAGNVMPARVMSSERGRAIGVRMTSTFTQLRYRVAADEAAGAAAEKVRAALDWLELEMESEEGPYLVGGSFSVADLTAASLFMPLVQPPEGPTQLALPEPLLRFRDEMRDRPAFRWVQETYARDRRPS